jgi:adenosylcobinamide-GDP ribazoletransferase
LGFLSLLSRLRFVRKEVDFVALARRQYLFPVAGFIIGAIVAIFAFLFFDLVGNEVDVLLKSLAIVLFYYLITGLMHIEGLADFGDGLMASGTQERKRQAMKDVSLGAAGVFFLVASLLTLFFLVLNLGGWSQSPALLFWTDSIPLIWGLILAEMSAKLSMITVMTIGPSSHEGMGSVFISAARPWKLVAASIIAVSIAFLLAGILSIIVLLGLVAGVFIAWEARRHFGGVGGDGFGAANELGKILTLLAWVVLL